jgi:hypothetical protein
MGMYQFSSTLGTFNWGRSVINKVKVDNSSEGYDFLLSHGIQEHLIILSLDEICQNNSYVKFMIQTRMAFDVSVIALN